MTNRIPDLQLEEFRVSLETAIESFGLDPLSENQTSLLIQHYSILVQWNRRTNLTRVIAPKEAARLHYAESLYGSRFGAGAQSILDVGSGAGFPAVPLAVALADCMITALEANRKKSLFLSEVKDALSLDNFVVAQKRFEELDWSGFDLITSRALDRAVQIWPKGLEAMRERQRILLYCSPDLVSRLLKGLSSNIRVETHSIPLADNRIIALFSRG